MAEKNTKGAGAKGGGEGRDREALSRVVYEAQVCQQQAQALQQQLSAIRASATEIEATLETLRAMGGMKDGNVLVPVGAGVQARGKISDTEKVLYELGAGVIVEKSVAEAISALTERRISLQNARSEMERGLSELGGRLQKLDAEAKRLVGKMRGSGVQPPEE
ncbi:MAG: prefoldin subunit alpha [Candidatus Micrarchaeota archaeon]